MSDSPLIEIDRPGDHDWPRIAEILRTANYHQIGGTEMPEFPLSDCFVARSDSRIVGVAGYRLLDEETAKTTLMAVDPQCRGLGIGRALQAKRMRYLKSLGRRRLLTNCDDDRVIAWYIREFGYRRTGAVVQKTENFGLNECNEWITLEVDLGVWEDPNGG